jgi:hypothetical protein
VRLRKVTQELRRIEELLKSKEELAPHILTDFRDAVNRVRNTAWVMEQYANSKITETEPKAVLSLLAGERVRVAYQLCKLIQSDLASQEIQFKKGQLLQFHEATEELAQELSKVVGA